MNTTNIRAARDEAALVERLLSQICGELDQLDAAIRSGAAPDEVAARTDNVGRLARRAKGASETVAHRLARA